MENPKAGFGQIIFLLFSLELFTIFLITPTPTFAVSPYGWLDQAASNCTNIQGWAGDSGQANNTETVQIYADGTSPANLLGTLTANIPREPTVCQILGGGTSCNVCPTNQPQCQHGFLFSTPASIKDGKNHQIYASSQGVALQGSPMTINCSSTQAPIIKVYNITDEQINGFAYDPVCPNVPAEVHIYHGDKWANGADRPTICEAKYACVWPGVCLNGNSNGFWCTPRHPLNSNYVTDPAKLNYKIVAVSKCRPNTVTWLDTSTQNPPIIRTVIQNRENDTIFIDRPKYKVGISKRFGGAITEYYSKSGSADDAIINLIKPAAGEALQTTVFGKNPVGSGKDCFGNTASSGFGIQGPVYNPTQTGSYCAVPNPSDTQILKQTADQLQFQTHYKNFTYPQQTNESLYRQYQPYDDVWGKINYTFNDNLIQIDYDVWKTGATSYGTAIQQFPIAFLNNLTQFTYQQNGVLKTTIPTLSSVIKFPILGNTDGRWFTGQNAQFTARDGTKVSPDVQNSYLTIAMYSGKVNNVCPQRYLQINNVPFGFGNTYLSNTETTTVTAQNYLELELKQNNHIQARSYIFPYRYTDKLPNSPTPLSDLLGQPESYGGFVPPWECNYQPVVYLQSDLNSLLSNFGKTGAPGFVASDLNKNGTVDIFDFNILSQYYGQ